MYMVVGADGLEYGPVDLQTLQAWVQQGRIGQQTVLKEMPSLYPTAAGNVPGLAHMFRPQQQFNMPVQQGGIGNFPTPGAPQVSLTPNDPVRYGGTLPPGMNMAPITAPYKSRLLAAILALFLGAFGAHKFYLGDYTLGCLMAGITLLTGFFCSPVIAAWGIYDFVMIITGNVRDQYGRDLM